MKGMLRKKLLSFALAASLLLGQASAAIGHNQAQAAQTEPEITLVYEKDFDDLSVAFNWSDNSQVSYEDGKLRIKPGAGVVYDLDSPRLTDTVIKFDATLDGEAAEKMGFGFHMNSTVAGEYAFVGIDVSDEWRVANGSSNIPFQKHYEPVLNEEMHIKIVVEGYTTELFINGESMGVVTKNDIPGAGYFGARLWGTRTGILTDNLQISKIEGSGQGRPTTEKSTRLHPIK